MRVRYLLCIVAAILLGTTLKTAMVCIGIAPEIIGAGLLIACWLAVLGMLGGVL